MSLAVYELEVVKVKREAVKVIREAIKGGYYRAEDREKELRELCSAICDIYDVEYPKKIVVGKRCNSYYPTERTIYVENYSIISFLHELRHHMQHVKGLKYEGLTIEQDSRAFSMRLYALAVPKMFLKAVKENKVLHIKWDSKLNKVVDNARYI